MKILLTGSEGFIASHLKGHLEDEYDCIDLELGSDIRGRLPDKNYSHIIHLGALKSVPLSEEAPYEFISTNCWGTVNLMRHYTNARFINISSSAANECKSIYGMTKHFSELAGLKHSNCVSIRLYNVFGEGQPLESGALVPIVFDAIRENKEITLYGGGIQSRDFTYVGDVVKFIKQQLYSSQTGTVDYGYGNPISVLDFVTKLSDGKLKFHTKPLRQFEIRSSCAPKQDYPVYYGREEGIRLTKEFYANS